MDYTFKKNNDNKSRYQIKTNEDEFDSNLPSSAPSLSSLPTYILIVDYFNITDQTWVFEWVVIYLNEFLYS